MARMRTTFRSVRREPGTAGDRLGTLVQWILAFVAFILPWFLLPGTGSPYEGSKQLFLVVGTALAAILWSLRGLLRRETNAPPRSIVIPVLAFLLALGVATAAGANWRTSLFGIPSYLSDAFLSVGAYVLLMLLCVSALRTERSRERFITALMHGTGVVIVAAYVQIVWQWIGTPPAGFQVFNLVANSSNVYGMFLAALVLLGAGKLLRIPRGWRRVVHALFLLAAFVLLLLIDSMPAWVVLILGSFTSITFLVLRSAPPPGRVIAVPLAVLGIGVLALFVHLPALSPVLVPQDTSLGNRLTWQVTAGILRHDPLTGTGPANFLAGLTEFRPAGLNASPVWNVPFVKGSSQWFQLAATGGMLAIAALLWVVVSALRAFLPTLRQTLRSQDLQTATGTVGLAAAWTGIALGGWFYTYSTATQFLFWTILALLVAQGVSSRAVQASSSRLRTLVPVGSILLMLLVLAAGVVVTRAYRAERFAHRADGLIRDVGDLTEVQRLTARAADENAFLPDYPLALAQSLLVEAQLALRENQGGSVTDVEDRITRASALMNHAVSLDPRNPRVYLAKADFYASLRSTVQDADTVVIRSLEQAVTLSPQSPIPLYFLGDTLLRTAEESVTDAGLPEDRRPTLARATATLQDAVRLRPDYLGALIRLVQAQELAGNADAAEETARTALTFYPRSVETNLVLAQLYQAHERLEEARQQYTRVLELAPDNPQALEQLTVVAEATGNLSQALEAIRHLADLKPDDTAIQDRLRDLEAKAAQQEDAGG
ncbi:MAG: hypothetical protein HY341_01280 [Candidatus Kerfeldbacteria bacterium]|nr:hypothetical protein [Candidatus Kerfeldbacteria bacterium]